MVGGLLVESEIISGRNIAYLQQLYGGRRRNKVDAGDRVALDWNCETGDDAPQVILAIS